MFKIGDKVVCVDTKPTYQRKINLTKYKIYDVIGIVGIIHNVKIKQDNRYYREDRFQLLTDYRKLKLNKIKQRI